MTDQRLRELLEERVSDLGATDAGARDLVSRAWENAIRTRRRWTAGAAGGVAVAVLAVTGGVAVMSEGGRAVEPAPPLPTGASASPTTGQPGGPAAHRAGRYQGAPVWWAPRSVEEVDLPILDVPALPARIDLRQAIRPVPAGVTVAGLFGARGRVVVLTDSGELYDLELSDLDRVTDRSGNAYEPLLGDSLAPDGRRAFFAQKGSLAVYDFDTAAWQEFDVPDWAAESARWVGTEQIFVPESVGSQRGKRYRWDGEVVDDAAVAPGAAVLPSEQGYGSERVADRGAARALMLNVTFRRDGDHSNGEVVAVLDGQMSVLAMPMEWPREHGPGRIKGCCPVLGWADDVTVLFASLSTEGNRILAWRVGTTEVRQVAEVLGGSAVSLAALQ